MRARLLVPTLMLPLMVMFCNAEMVQVLLLKTPPKLLISAGDVRMMLVGD